MGAGLCAIAQGWTFPAGRLVCAGAGVVPVTATLLAAMTVLACVAFAARDELPAIRRWIGAVSISLAALLLALASGQPSLEPVEAPKGGIIAALVDISDSMTRDGQFSARLDSLRNAAEDRLSKVPPDDRSAWRALAVAFDGTSEIVSPPGPLPSLLPGIAATPLGRVETGGSNLSRALQTVLDATSDMGLPTEILLMSDGNWLDGTLSDLIPAIVRRGIRINVLPAGTAAPSAGLVAANLAPSQTAGADARIRTVLRGAGQLSAATPATPEPVLRRSDGLESFGVPVHVTTRFASRGIRFATLGFQPDDGPTQTRRLLTTVRGPARVTAYGPAPWLDILPSERFDVARLLPAQGLPESFSDIIVIDAQAATEFAPEFPSRLAAAVSAGSGLFLINGRHVGSLEDPTLMAGWEETDIGPLLPVNSDGREVLRDHPPREVVIVIDASGSMDGGRLQTAKGLANRVINALRPIDKVEVIRFAEDMSVRMPMSFATPSGQSRAINAVNAISAGGGTDPKSVLKYAAKFAGNYCGIFFISDGDFNTAPNPPGCFTTVFEINEGGLLRNPHLARLGDVQPIRTGSALSRIAFKYLEPEPRTETFRPGSFIPVATTDTPELVPPLPVDGLAISYPRVDAERIAIHEDLPADPVVAFRRDIENPLAHTGVFMSAIPARWANAPQGRTALTAYMERLLGWSDPDLFAFEFAATGDRLTLSITPVDARVPADATLSAVIVLQDGREMALTPEPSQRTGRFSGSVSLPPGPEPADGLLLIRVGGEVSQRVPISLPPRSPPGSADASSEAWSFGVDHDRLRNLATLTGGQVLSGADFDHDPIAVADPRRTPVHPPIIVASLILFALGLWSGGGRP